MKHSVVRLDNVEYSPIETIRYNNGTADAAIDNGRVLKLDSLLDGERNIFKAVAPAADTALAQVVLVASPELMYEAHKNALSDFENEAGSNARGRGFYNGMKFSVTTDAIDGTAAVGNVVELQAGVKLKTVKTATAGSTQIGRVIAIETSGSLEYAVIRVEA